MKIVKWMNNLEKKKDTEEKKEKKTRKPLVKCLNSEDIYIAAACYRCHSRLF